MTNPPGSSGVTDDRPTVPDFPQSLEPHELLEILIGELQNPLDAIEGWANVINRDLNLEMISHEAAESIPAILTYIRALLERTERYLDARSPKRP